MVNVLPPKRMIHIPGHAPEDAVVDKDGNLIVGVDDGRVLRIDPITEVATVLAVTGGRPLGLEVMADGHILICDSPRGLLKLNPHNGHLSIVLDSFEGRPLRFCSNVTTSADGTIYFSTSTDRYTERDWRKDMFENIPTGRLFRLSPDGQLDLLCDGLYFANGLALAHDESWIMVAESGACRLRRVWLKGPKAGTNKIFAELPGFPDNCSMSADGLIWVAIATPKNAALEKLHRMPLLVRMLIARLPKAVQPRPEAVAWVMALDAMGNVIYDYCWTDGQFAMVTGVCQHERTVYLGSLVESAILSFELPL